MLVINYTSSVGMMIKEEKLYKKALYEYKRLYKCDFLKILGVVIEDPPGRFEMAQGGETIWEPQSRQRKEGMYVFKTSLKI